LRFCSKMPIRDARNTGADTPPNGNCQIHSTACDTRLPPVHARPRPGQTPAASRHGARPRQVSARSCNSSTCANKFPRRCSRSRSKRKDTARQSGPAPASARECPANKRRPPGTPVAPCVVRQEPTLTSKSPRPNPSIQERKSKH
jgi:hypothetical protein